MRSIFGVLSLLVVLAIVGMLAKKQLGSVQEIKVPTSPGTPAVSISADPGANVQQQSQQVQQQYKAAVEAAVQQPRPMPDEK